MLTFLLVATLTAQASWQSIFNGKDLDGWSGDPRLWRVQDGAIVGETDDAERKTNENSFLTWQGGKAGDFVSHLRKGESQKITIPPGSCDKGPAGELSKQIY